MTQKEEVKEMQRQGQAVSPSNKRSVKQKKSNVLCDKSRMAFLAEQAGNNCETLAKGLVRQ